MISSIRINKNNLVAVELANIGEGINGDFDPADPDDINFLRFYIYAYDGADMAYIDNASRCTFIPADITDEEALRMANYIMQQVYDPIIAEQSIDAICDKLSYLGCDYDTGNIPTLFVDMDGTIAQFYESSSCLDLYTGDPEFFEKLTPYPNAVSAINLLSRKHRRDLRICILSAVPAEYYSSVVRQKTSWLQSVFDEDVLKNIRTLYPIIGESKFDYARKHIGSGSYFLLDDYSKNLVEWEENNGVGIKALTELNGRGWNNTNFRGAAVSVLDPAEEICEALEAIIFIEEVA